MKYHLLTGGTGLLGRYLLRDLTLADIPLAVIVRRSRIESAVQRIETAMAHWEKELGHALVRPIVLEGDITQPLCGLSEEDQAWVAEYCDTAVHSAASLTFYADEEDGEPWRSNIQGTRNMLNLCRKAGIHKFHHVSTAYVCGQRREVIREDELDVGQLPSNDYESSKITSEKEVRAADFIEQLTVHRPSIIVGDSQTGFTTSYHGFYTPLRLVHTLVTTLPWDVIAQGDWLGTLSLEGHERKNLVPVDWVSAVMTDVISRPELHGETYHFTNPNPATVADMLASIGDAVLSLAKHEEADKSSLTEEAEKMMESFRDQMGVYQSYWSDDPTFDSSRTQAAMPHLPCPQVDQALMDLLVKYAIEKNFGWPRETPVSLKFPIAQDLAPWMKQSKETTLPQKDRRYVSLRVSGNGGGQWHMILNQGQLVGVGSGLKNGDSPICYMNSDTFHRITHGQLSWEAALQSGRLFTAGNATSPEEIAHCFHQLATSSKSSN
ncbi:NAD-dependent epimerase/dehydratase family protein [bacterium]|nr:NAD-dependent epimerase/dehydratase family protein [bacterium]